MPPKKRAYVPKTKGCRECSKRRIHCDRTEPSCYKCTSRGLSCSGLGIRHRFNKGVAARGKWAGKTIDKVYEENEWKVRTTDQDAQTSSTISTVTQLVETAGCLPHDDDQLRDFGTHTSSSSPNFQHLNTGQKGLPDDHSVSCTLFLHDIQETTPAWKRNLFLTFSQCISTEMVAIDGVHNDWRHLLLPLAQQDELVMNAVLTVSAFYFHINKLENSLRQRKQQYHAFGNTSHDSYVPDPYLLLSRTLQGLQKRQELNSGDQVTQHSVLVTLLLLMTSDLVTGGSDFPMLLRMLDSALDAVGGKEGLGTGILPGFIMRELHKIRVYAAPHLGEETGLQMISSQARTDQLFGCLNHCLQLYPEHAPLFSQVANLVYQARDIYLQQVLSDQTTSFFDLDPIPANPGSVARVQRFIETLGQIPHTSPIAHILIWTTFVAASDAQLDEHKSYFEDELRRHHAR
ncbi:unnamed protein product, partial [Fusarium langsethiae]